MTALHNCPKCGTVMEPPTVITMAKGRYDEALLRKCLEAMPLGKYHTLKDNSTALARDGKIVTVFSWHDRDDAPKIAGLVAALVHLLNARQEKP